MNPVVFAGSLSIIAGLLLINFLYGDSLSAGAGTLQSLISHNFSWLYIFSMTFFLIVTVAIAFSPVGRMRLGPDDSRPEFGTFSWLAMLFSAGMGIGILFYSVAEPVMHFTTPSPQFQNGVYSGVHNAMGVTFFHWGLHPWACYALVGLVLSYFSYRKGLPLSLRSALYPFIGKRIYGRIGDGVDTLTIVSTLFGVATSLGLGAMQVSSGFEHVFGWKDNKLVQTGIVVVITLFAILSVVSGLKRGVRYLSQINMSLATVLLVIVFATGPSVFLLDAFVENIGVYLQMLPVNSFWTASFQGEGRQWLGSWTIFYWAWWIAWSPFVGIFIARVSRGRTVREFLTAVLLIPTLMTFIWLTVFGDSALYFEVIEKSPISQAVQADISTAVFHLLEKLPFGGITSLLTIASIILFFVTSSDSASLVIDSIASGGMENPPVWQKIFWAALEGFVAGLLLILGGLTALQTGAITSALPFCAILLVATAGLFVQLRRDLAE